MRKEEEKKTIPTFLLIDFLRQKEKESSDGFWFLPDPDFPFHPFNLLGSFFFSFMRCNTYEGGHFRHLVGQSVIEFVSESFLSFGRSVGHGVRE